MNNISILEPLYVEVSEISGYLWQRGWEELNAGNRYRAENDQSPITMNIPKNKRKGK